MFSGRQEGMGRVATLAAMVAPVFSEFLTRPPPRLDASTVLWQNIGLADEFDFPAPKVLPMPRAENPIALSMLALVWTGCLLFAGCESQPAADPSVPQAGKSSTANDGDDILPPQSEPPVVDDEHDETAATSESNSDQPAETAPPEGKTHSLFAGKNLDDWERSNFGGEGELELKDDAVIVQRGADLTGMHWKGKPLPKINYEVTLEAQRIDGSDFFCGIVFPVNDSFCSFVAGGWGGSTIGLSSVDDIYAAENETGTYASFEERKWYAIKLRVSDSAITAWIDGKQYVYLKTKGRKLSLHPAMEPAKPFGVAAFSTVASIRDIKLRELTEEEIAAEAKEAAE